MKTDDRNNPLFPDFEADKCLYFRRNHDILLGPLSDLLFHASYIGHYICRMDYHISRRSIASDSRLRGIQKELLRPHVKTHRFYRSLFRGTSGPAS